MAAKSNRRVLAAGEPPLVFNHVPKTAGTSFRSVLCSHFRTSEIAPATHARSLELLEPGYRYALFAGHFTYSDIAAIVPGAVHVTFLRDPVARVISQYRNWHAPYHRPGYWNHLKEVDPAAARAIAISESASLLEFVTSDDRYIQKHVSNTQTCYVHPASEGREALFHGQGVYSRSILSESLNSLFERFSYFGLSEQFEKSMHKFAWEFSTPEPLRETPRLNPGVGEIDVSPEVIESIQERNRMDLDLYAEAVLEFERRYLEMARSAVSSSLLFDATEAALHANATVVPATAMSHGDGWHAPEVSEDGREFRWTARRADVSVIVPLVGRHVKAEVVVCCLPITPRETWTGMMAIADRFTAVETSQTIDPDSSLLIHKMILQPNGARADSLGQTVRITSPIVKGDSRDPRDLGVALHQVRWRWLD